MDNVPTTERTIALAISYRAGTDYLRSANTRCGHAQQPRDGSPAHVVS
ncbi:hypothetical protein ACFQ78_11080 [Streptomyces sp. NPDC056519]